LYFSEKINEKKSNNLPDELVAVIDEVADVAAAEAVEAASATSVVGHFGPASWEAKPADSPTPVTMSTAPDRREVVEAVEEEVEAATVVADDRPVVVGSGNHHKVPTEKTVAWLGTHV